MELAEIRRIAAQPRSWLVVVIAVAVLPGLKVPGPFNIALVFLISSLAIVGLIRRYRSASLQRAEWLLLLFIGVLLVSVLWALPGLEIPAAAAEAAKTDIHFSRFRFVWQIAAWILGFGVIFFLVRAIRTISEFRLTVKVLIVMGVFVTAWAAWELIARWLDLPYLYLSSISWGYRPTATAVVGNTHIFRPYGPLEEPKQLAQFLMIPMFLMLSNWSIGKPWYWLALALFSFVIFLLTVSSPAYVGLIFGSIVWLGLSIRSGTIVRVRGWAFLTGAVVLLFLVAAIFARDELVTSIEYQYTRYVDITSMEIQPDAVDTGVVRVGAHVGSDYVIGWKYGWRLFLDNPILGVGLGNSPFFSGVYDRILTPFSLYLSIMAEAGLFGILTFVIFIGYVIYRAMKASLDKSLNPEIGDRSALIALVAALIGIFPVYQTFGGTRFMPYDWMLFGVLIAASTVILKKQDQAK